MCIRDSCNSVYAENEELFVEAFNKALLNNSPTIIVVKENYDWLDYEQN